MKFIFYLFSLIGFIGVQKVVTKSRFSNLFLLAGIAQLCYSVLLFLIFGVNYNFQIQFVGFWWFILVFSVTLVFGSLLKASQTKIPQGFGFQLFLSVGILLPISEEILFRGVLLHIYPNSIMNAATFALVHLLNVFSKFEGFSLYNLAYRLIVGYIFSLSVLRTNSLFCSTLCHVLNNLVGLTILFLSEHVSKKGN